MGKMMIKFLKKKAEQSFISQEFVQSRGRWVD